MKKVNQDLLDYLISQNQEVNTLLEENSRINEELKEDRETNTNTSKSLTEKLETKLLEKKKRKSDSEKRKRISEIKKILENKVKNQKNMTNNIGEEKLLLYKSLADSIVKENYENAAFYRNEILKCK